MDFQNNTKRQTTLFHSFTLSYNAFLESPACHLAVITSSRGSLQDSSFIPLSHNPSLTLLSNSHLPVTLCPMTRHPEPLGLERAGPSWLVHCARPKALRQHFMAVQWALGYPTQGWSPGLYLGPNPSHSHTREKAHSRQYPPGHQLLSIVTAGGGGKAQESRGKSGVVKGKTGEIVRRNCG